MIANASGNAAKSAIPPSTSQVSFPSQIGATEAIIRSRARSSGASGKRIPTPRSKPSSSTYMKTPTARISVQIGTRSRVIVAAALPVLTGRRGERARRAFGEPRLVRLELLRQPALHQPHEVVDAEAEDGEIHDSVGDQGRQHFTTRDRRGDRCGGAQVPVDDERLPADLGRDPAGGHGDVADGNGPRGRTLEGRRREQPPVPREPPCPCGQREHGRRRPDTHADAESTRYHLRTGGLRKAIEA